MFDGFWSGIIGGIFGPPVLHFLGRFRYPAIFAVTFFVTGISFVVFCVFKLGVARTVQGLESQGGWSVLIVPGMSATLITFGAWFVAILNPREKRDDDK
ncbi:MULTISPECIES: hypothetical protein [Dyella]|uniref:Uncharacterized protein n=2 Tax=Dyella TaxID=231454 RepID=A0A4R0YPW9_9GAMM|nr:MULTISPECIES: hypothetical protein [Dyella]TBR35851.1 hypothetical protein EYV96_17820 [Dyella terrae]TCI08601.1 hypothetical protein EZM97_28735 [Dyella soli]